MSLPGVRSGPLVSTPATFLSTWPAATSSSTTPVTSKMRASPSGRVPIAQVSTCESSVQPSGASEGVKPAGSGSLTTTSGAGTVPPLKARIRKVASSPGSTTSGPTMLFSTPTSTTPGVNDARSPLSSKLSGSKLEVPVSGRTLLDSARFSTWVPAVSGASVLWIVITRSVPGAELGDVAEDERNLRVGRRAEALAGRVVAADAGPAGDRDAVGGSATPPAGCRPPRSVHCPGSVAVDGQRVGDRASRDRLGLGAKSFVIEMSAIGSVEIAADALLSSGLISVPIGADTVATLSSSAADG